MNNEYFFSRRTIRKYADREVSERLIEEITAAAAKAPTTGNMQLYSVIETRNDDMRRELASLHFNQPAATGAPVMLTVCADLYRFNRWCEVSGADVGFDNFLSFIYAISDALIFTQQIVTIAEMKGLGTCYLGTVLSNTPEISKLLKLPKGVIPVACLSLGWPAEEGEETERLEVGSILHRETYPELSDEDIVNVYKVKEDFAPNAKFISENGKENLAQVFAEVRYPRSQQEGGSEKFLAFLRENSLI